MPICWRLKHQNWRLTIMKWTPGCLIKQQFEGKCCYPVEGKQGG